MPHNELTRWRFALPESKYSRRYVALYTTKKGKKRYGFVKYFPLKNRWVCGNYQEVIVDMWRFSDPDM